METATFSRVKIPDLVLVAAGLDPQNSNLKFPSRERAVVKMIGRAFTPDDRHKRLMYTRLPPIFIDALAAADDGRLFRPVGWEGLPITRLAYATKQAGVSRGVIDEYPPVSTDPEGWVLHCFWCAHVAPRKHGWPDTLVKPLRRFFCQSSGLVMPGIPFTRAMRAIWEHRSDLQDEFDLKTCRSRASYLVWLLTVGLKDLELRVSDLDSRLPLWLSLQSRLLPGVTVGLELAILANRRWEVDFDITTQNNRNAYVRWAIEYGPEIFKDMPFLEIIAIDANQVRANYAKLPTLTREWLALDP